MNIRIDKCAGIRVVELARFAACHGCELINQNDEILIRLSKGCELDIQSVSVGMDFGLPLRKSNSVSRHIG